MIGRLQTILVTIGLFISSLFAAFYLGKRKERKQELGRELNEYVETRKRIDNAVDFTDVDAATDFLRKRKSDRDL